MKNLLLALACSCFFSSSFAQVKEVIEAEKSFAAFAKENNTRDAFLKYMDTNAVVFDKGVASAAVKIWTAHAVDRSKLLWKPAFAGASNAGDLGFTTGPWEFRTAMDSSAVAFGQFATIWHKTSTGEWKFLVDLGISYGRSLYNQKGMVIAAPPVVAKVKEKTEAMTIEKNFLLAYETLGEQALLDAFHPKAWLNINQHEPLRGLNEIKSGKGLVSKNILFTPIDGGISKSNDFVYIYGDASYAGKKENYLRVWQRTNAGWKIMLMVLK